MMTTKEAIEKRRSIRKFKSDSIPFEHIEDIMDSARDAMRGIYKDLELLNGNGNGKVVWDNHGVIREQGQKEVTNG